ncbi:M23 family metallopeptidase [Streptomyces sp. NPDC091377]|uniref:M23 family metallopeptidase n=1 Tax=unclassified Streptomyces TaxID=2593676 RepID=UPI0037FC08FC
MAFTRATGKHRRPTRLQSTTARAAGVAALTTTGVVGTFAAPALAAGQPAQQPGLSPVISIDDSVAEQIDAQASAQMEAARVKAEAEARKKAQAEAKKRAVEQAEREREAEERAAREAERERLNRFVSPVGGSYVSTSYQANSGLWSSGSHTGIDFHASVGTVIQSVGSGTVVEAGWGNAYGNQVVIKMNDGTYTQYAHLSSISVSAGQVVEPGQQIGLAGDTGNVTGAHLHFEARSTSEYGSDIDPLSYLRARGVSL